MPFSLSTRPTDHELESAVARVLLVGVSLSALIVIIGAVLYLAHTHTTPDYRHFRAPTLHNPISTAFRAALHGSPTGLIQCGLLVLIATPVARVALCLGGFALQRDRLYVLVSAIVLAVLLFSFLHSGV
ncbi:DUF1634 domain-containing protein [Granulicella sp. 5B5]|uniref:DUF1634 domain-containing protein n=1 Tax=Granulicella sp. 5B5 TaxID=1617967 RepID=UPI0015F600D2|nr:DUF1634 domain-containing protein [Granulicella sp. 5B5]QMV18039.1 DUF1634 domain-containing protein [Granulicella sp. 5B5]